MTMDFVRRHYGVKVKRGMRVAFQFGTDRREFGTVTGATQYVRVRFDGAGYSVNIHPTDPALTYEPEEPQP